MLSVSVALLQLYNFDQHALLLTLVQLTGQLAQHAAFPQVCVRGFQNDLIDVSDRLPLLTCQVGTGFKASTVTSADSLLSNLSTLGKPSVQTTTVQTLHLNQAKHPNLGFAPLRLL